MCARSPVTVDVALAVVVVVVVVEGGPERTGNGFEP